MLTFTADRTTAQLACCKRGRTRSMMLSASFAVSAWYLANESNMKTCIGYISACLDTCVSFSKSKYMTIDAFYEMNICKFLRSSDTFLDLFYLNYKLLSVDCELQPGKLIPYPVSACGEHNT